MSQTQTATRTATYSATDVQIVARRFLADLLMITESTGATAEVHARNWAHDVEALAEKGYLRAVDLTLLVGTIEFRATRFDVDTTSGQLTMSKPGGVMWPRIEGAELRIILFYTAAYDDAAREVMRSRLKIGWVPVNADTSHSTLSQTGGRDYASNLFGLRRTDFGL